MRRAPLLTIALLVVALPAVAQTGSLEILLFDAATQTPVPGATVKLSSAKGMLPDAEALSDAHGRVVFPVLHAGGGYIVEVSMPGYAGLRTTDLRVRSNETEQVVLVLSPELHERVQAGRQRSIVDLEKSGTSSRFSDEFIEQLPVPGRFYQNLLTLAPGVKDAEGDGNPNVHGARARDFKALVSGISNVDPLTGEWLNYVNAASIDELEIITTGAGVEFGRAQGGFARIIQKQGGNDFDGLFEFIYRSSDIDGTGATGIEQELFPPFEWEQSALQISGPFVRDKLWYRASHEYLDRADPVLTFGIPALSRLRQSMNDDQLTWQVSPRNKLSFHFQSSPLIVQNFGIGPTVPPDSSYTIERSGPTYALSWIAPVSSRLLFDSQIAYQDNGQDVTPTTSGVRQQCMVFSNIQWSRVLRSALCQNTIDGRYSGSYNETSHDARQRLTVQSQGTYFVNRFLGSSHRLKFGFAIEDERYYRELDRGSTIRFNIERRYIDPCPFGGSRPCGQDIGFATVQTSVPRGSFGRANGTNWGVYIEDQLRPADNVSLTLGLRLDRQEIGTEGRSPFDPRAESAAYAERYRMGASASIIAKEVFTAFGNIEDFQLQLAEALEVDPDLLSMGSSVQQSHFWDHKQRLETLDITDTYLSPRLAVGWDPWGDGKTKFAMSAGRYHDKIFLAVPLLEQEPATTNLLFQGLRLFSDRFSTFGPAGGTSPTVSTRLVDRGLRTPYQDEWTLSAERTLWRETALKLSYIRRHFRDQLQDTDINHLPGDRGRCVVPAVFGGPTVIASPGFGNTLIDPYTGEIYDDTNRGPGDGRIDDCSGGVDTYFIHELFPPTEVSSTVPDGLDDLYALNPGWGEVLLVGNFNTAEYKAWVLEFLRRQYRNWQMQASYTWSKAFGDAEDFMQTLGNERNLLEDEHGYLAFDQRHVVVVSSTAVLPHGWRIGETLRWESGLPYSILHFERTVFAVPPEYLNLGSIDPQLRIRFPTGQRNDQRNASFWTVDLRLAREFRLPRKVYMQLTGEVFNLLNDDTPRVTQNLNAMSAVERKFGRRFQFGLRLAF